MSYRNVGDLIADMRASKEPFQLATPGVSTVNHLAAVIDNEETKWSAIIRSMSAKH